MNGARLHGRIPPLSSFKQHCGRKQAPRTMFQNLGAEGFDLLSWQGCASSFCHTTKYRGRWSLIMKSILPILPCHEFQWREQRTIVRWVTFYLTFPFHGLLFRNPSVKAMSIYCITWHTGIWNTRGFGTRDQPKSITIIFLNNTLQQRIY